MCNYLENLQILSLLDIIPIWLIVSWLFKYHVNIFKILRKHVFCDMTSVTNHQNGKYLIYLNVLILKSFFIAFY